ncbi:MAG TPA: hypothetical protein VKP66_00260 [Steroidobacteraceae bacterium]|nr:hypothetical protein [Steroidobacteraceae bacterium]
MTANTIAPANAPAAARFDAKFIEDHQLIDRYLEGRLPAKGARDLENWCRANPAYLEALKLSERTQSGLKLLEACGAPIDLTEPNPPWWKSPYVPVGAGAVALVCLLGFWALFGKYALLRQDLEDTRTRMNQGSLVQPAGETTMRVVPDGAPGIDKARIVVNRSTPQLVDLHIDLGYSKQLQQYRMFIDKHDQGRALILNDLLKDSNGELRLTFNTTGLAAGIYNVRIESLPVRASGSPVPEGWLILEVR